MFDDLEPHTPYPAITDRNLGSIQHIYCTSITRIYSVSFQHSSTSSPLSPHTFLEVPLLKLGSYDPCKNTNFWDFGTTWDNNQWQKPNMSLLGSRENFTGPTPRPTGELRGVLGGPLQYFLHFWPLEVLAMIIEETNR